MRGQALQSSIRRRDRHARAWLTTAAPEETRTKSSCQAKRRRISFGSGGGGNRTRVRGRTGKASTSLGRAWGFARTAGSRPTYRRASHPLVLRLGRLAFLRREARLLMPPPGSRAESGATRWLVVQTRQRVRDGFPHLRCFPVVLRGRPETSACDSAGEPTTSKPWRPR